MSLRLTLAAATALIPMALSAPAPARAGEPDGLLAALPAHAPPGVCYARVRQDAQWTPPGPARARWRLEPGSPGPVWCLVSEPGAPPALLRAERSGWIRVLCDGDQTPARIGALQRRLHDRGLYEGAYSGRMDAATLSAVRRFQSERRIADGGYLGLRTVAALEGGAAGPFPPPRPVPVLSASAPVAMAAAGGPCCVLGAAPPPPPPVMTIAVPAPVPPRSPWLSWSGKSVY